MNLYGPVRAAEFEGTAEVVLSFAAWPEGFVEPTVHTIPVQPPKKGPKPLPATDRLTKTLPHPDRQATVGVVRFSPDGTRLMGSGYPSGVVQFWDTKTWTEVTRIDTPSGLRTSWDYAVPTPDWKAVLVYGRTRKPMKEEKDGKVTDRLQIDGRIDRYDTAAGKLTDTIPLPGRGPQQFWLAPDGKTAVLNMEGSFAATDADRPQTTELVDLTTKTATKLFDSFAMPTFTPDGKAAYVATVKYNRTGGAERSLVKLDLATGKVTAKKEFPDAETYFASPTLSPDGKRLFAHTGRAVKQKTEDFALVALDPATFAEKGRVPGELKPDDGVYAFDPLQFTPDGQTVVTRLGNRVFVWDVAADNLVSTVAIPDTGHGFSAVSPDGRRFAIAGRPKFDLKALGSNPDPEDLPQPRVILLDLTDGKSEPAVLMLPPGASGGAAFSPDGKTLAVGGGGGVYLLDVTGK